MARKCLVAREQKRRKLVERNRDRRDALRKAVINPELTPAERQEALFKLSKLPRDSSSSRLTYRCELTGRSRGVYRKFLLSRIKFREMASSGLLPGVTKSSW